MFYELTRSICPECRRVIDAQVILRESRNPFRCHRIKVSGFTTIKRCCQATSRDSVPSTNRVASSARRGFTCRSTYSANCFREEQILRRELGSRPQRQRRQPPKVVCDAEEGSNGQTRPGPDHASGWYAMPR